MAFMNAVHVVPENQYESCNNINIPCSYQFEP